MSNRLIASLVAAIAVAGCATNAADEPPILRDVQCIRDSEGLDPDIWEPVIEEYEVSDVDNPPDPGSVVFVGSSSIWFWDTLSEDMVPLAALNRGFGGSVIAHATHFADRIVLPYEPSAIVLYAGDNDMALGLSAECTLRHYEAFVAHIHAAAPDTPIYFVSIKPSPARWALWEDMRRANTLVEARTTTHSALHFIDVSEAMLDEGSEPIEALFVEDGLHLNAAGYELWTSIIRPRLLADLGL